MKKTLSFISAAIIAASALAPFTSNAFDPDGTTAQQYISGNRLERVGQKYEQLFDISGLYPGATSYDRTNVYIGPTGSLIYSKKTTGSAQRAVITLKNEGNAAAVEKHVKSLQSSAVFSKTNNTTYIADIDKKHFKTLCLDLKEAGLISDFDICFECTFREDYLPGGLLCFWGGSDGCTDKIINYLTKYKVTVDAGVAHPIRYGSYKFLYTIKTSGAWDYDCVYDHIDEIERITNGTGNILNRTFTGTDLLILNAEKMMSLNEQLELALDIWNKAYVGPIVCDGDRAAVTVVDHFNVFDCVDGDANCDGKLTLADSAAILQSLANADKYGLSEKGTFNADVYGGGDGISALDALQVQKILAGMV